MSLTRVFTSFSLRRTFLSPQLRRFADHSHGHDHHTPQWNEPGGYLFNEKPLPPGTKRVKEGWEDMWYMGMGGGFLLISLYLYYKPDTNITTWAMQEAEKSLQEKGVSLDYRREPQPQTISS